MSKLYVDSYLISCTAKVYMRMVGNKDKDKYRLKLLLCTGCKIATYCVCYSLSFAENSLTLLYRFVSRRVRPARKPTGPPIRTFVSGDARPRKKPKSWIKRPSSSRS